MTSEFKKAVRNKNVKWPTERGFSLSRWSALWENVKDASDEDYGLFMAGKVFSCLLEDIRKELCSLYKTAPKVTNKQLLMIHCGMSNRDRSIIERFDDNGTSPLSLRTLTIDTNVMSNSVTLDEVAHVCVDGIQKALFFIINKGSDPIKSNTPKPILEFTALEGNLSQLYDMYEKYWHCLVWGGYCNQRSKNQQKQRIKTRTNSAAQTSAYQEIPTTNFLRPSPTIF